MRSWASGWRITCIGFLRKYGLQNEIKLNIEQGHAILTGHSFEHELAYRQVLRMGGFTTGGANFDAKLRRRPLDPVDRIAAYLGGMDICAGGLTADAAMLADGGLDQVLAKRYAGRETPGAQTML